MEKLRVRLLVSHIGDIAYPCVATAGCTCPLVLLAGASRCLKGMVKTHTIVLRPFSEKTRRQILPLLTSKEWWEETTFELRKLFALGPMRLVDEQKLAAVLRAGAYSQLSAFLGLVGPAEYAECASSDDRTVGLVVAGLTVGTEPLYGGDGRNHLVGS